MPVAAVPAPGHEQLVTIRELARRLGVARSTAYELLRRDPYAPKPIKLGTKSVRFTSASIDRWIMELQARAEVGM